MKEFWIAFEGGGSKTRILLAEPAGAVLAREVGGSSSGLYIEPDEYSAMVRELLAPVQRNAEELDGKITAVGLAGPMSGRIVKRILWDALGPVRLVWAGESEIALALYDVEVGISIVAGTGSVCWGRNETGRWSCCGGWGPQFGDEGSGYWIGREAVAAVFRSYQGLGPKTSMMWSGFGTYFRSREAWQQFRKQPRNGHLFPPQVAALAGRVFDAARAGDAVARKICNTAGKHLARHAIAVAEQADPKLSPIPVVLTGGVFNGGGLVTTPMKRALRKSAFEFHVHPPVPEPAEGILKVIQRDLEGRRTRVSRSVL